MPGVVHGAANSDAKKSQARQNLTAIGAVLGKARATTAENDLLAAVGLAARSLSPTATGRTLVIVDSGLQSTAPLAFQDKGMLAAEPDQVAGYLADNNGLPDLKDVRVVLSGFGDTAAPQVPLSAAQRKNLIAIWKAIFERAGGIVEQVDQPMTAAPLTGLPAVSVVPVPAAPSFAATGTQPAKVELDDQTVAFVPDTARYRDPAGVKELLQPLADQISAKRLAVQLTGTAASAGTATGRRKLSLQRAEAVRDTLVSLGVDRASIVAKGVGSDWPGHVPDLDADGHLLPGAAAQNRLVIVEAKAS
ncbi:hypothetical protein GCM10010435_76560 [Winogradskya consettensis]|uniref:OmpA-like domain-containing protein n=2 Tax=Winogradskya consettensis TaxID=113560 RepID=A0A919VZD4_9ACTN|nr:hypothetical protein Aco04nite_40770 [Actinoplanes consettensis]